MEDELDPRIFADITGSDRVRHYQQRLSEEHIERAHARVSRSRARIRYWRRSNNVDARTFRRMYPGVRFRINENLLPEVYVRSYNPDLGGYRGWLPINQVEHFFPAANNAPRVMY